MPKQPIGIKQLFKGKFIYSHELFIEYSYAHSKEQARVIMCRRLAKKHDVHPATVLSLFSGEKPNYEITMEVEYRDES